MSAVMDFAVAHPVASAWTLAMLAAWSFIYSASKVSNRPDTGSRC